MARNWNSLSPAYRNRLQKGGITQQAYEAGASLSKARGHQNTPERPEDANKNPKRYGDYIKKRLNLRDQVIKRKKEYFGRRPRFNDEHSRKYVFFGVDNLIHFEMRPPTLSELRKALKMTDDELDRTVAIAARMRKEEEEVYAFLFYH